jgi:hypothetical protein
MPQLHDLLRSLGGLHDAVLIAIVWKSDARQIKFEFSDLNANFRGLPEYKGVRRGKIVLESVEILEIQLGLTYSGLRVYDWMTRELPDGAHQSVITFSPEGRIIANHGGGMVTDE